MTDIVERLHPLPDELHAVARALREEIEPFEVNAPDLHMTTSLALTIIREAAAEIQSLRERVERLEEAIPDRIELFRMLRAAGRSDADKAKALDDHFRRALNGEPS